VKAHEADLDASMLATKGYHGFFHCAEKKGYAGVALYAKKEPESVVMVSA
jgi:exodeoxyribonuclease-3